MKKIVAFILWPAALIAAPQLQFLNKLKVPIMYLVGTKENPPKNMGSKFVIDPGKESKLDAPENPWILIHEQGKPENAFIYQFNTAGKKKLAIRIVASGAGSKIEPQTTLGMKISGNVTPHDIIPIGAGSTLGAITQPAPAPAPVASVHPPKIAIEDKPLPAPKPAEEAPIVPQAPPLTVPVPQAPPPQAPPLIRPVSIPVAQAPIPQAPPLTPAVPKAPPLTRPVSIPAAPPLGPVVPPAPPMTQQKVETPAAPAPKVSGPVMSEDLQKEIQKGIQLKKAREKAVAQPARPRTPEEEAILKRRSIIAGEEEEEEGGDYLPIMTSEPKPQAPQPTPVKPKVPAAPAAPVAVMPAKPSGSREDLLKEIQAGRKLKKIEQQATQPQTREMNPTEEEWGT